MERWYLAQMKVGLFFGSFNPVHIGHLILANHIQQNTDLDEVWWMVTPHNPFKKKNTLAPNYERLHMVQLAIEEYPYLRAKDTEFALPQPSYTVETLAVLREKHPAYTFHLIMGSDNLSSFHKWKNHDQILRHHRLKVFSRKGSSGGDLGKHEKVDWIQAPEIEISATFIRSQIQNKKNFRPWLPQKVWEYLDGSSLYA